MKRFLSICLFVVLSILLTPMFSDNYNAQAGRVLQGSMVSPECTCGVVGPECYEDNPPHEPCNYAGYLSRPASSPETGKTDNNTNDTASIVLMLFATAYMFRRFLH